MLYTENALYRAYGTSNLRPGYELQIDRTIHVEQTADISELTAYSLGDLEAMEAASIADEERILAEALAVVEKWHEHALRTSLIKRAVEWHRTPRVAHTNNVWTDSKGSWSESGEISNTVYGMYYNIWENTKYDRELGKPVPVSWHLSWRVYTNTRNQVANRIAGQDRKLFRGKAAMRKYLDGRIKAYSHLFEEVSPTIPKELVGRFCVNGQLLPGYTVED